LIYAARGVAGLAAIVIGAILYPTGTFKTIDRALPVALFFFGGFVWTHAILDLVFRELLEGADPDANPTDGLRSAIGAFIAVPGGVLALLSVFSKGFTTVVQVGVGALVVSLVLSAMLFMFLLIPVQLTGLSDARKTGTMNFFSVLVTLTLWGIVLGLACVGSGIIFK
jgi:hypothetical protein